MSRPETGRAGLGTSMRGPASAMTSAAQTVQASHVWVRAAAPISVAKAKRAAIASGTRKAAPTPRSRNGGSSRAASIGSGSKRSASGVARESIVISRAG